MIESNEVDEIFLGILLNNGNLVYSIIDKVLPNMLDGEPNQIIFRTIVKLASSGVDIAKVLLKNQLVNDSVFNSVGGDGYLDYLVVKGNTANPETIFDYANAIIENYRRRELVRFSVRLQSLANQDSIATISRASKFLTKLATLGGNTEDVVLLGDALNVTLGDVKRRVLNPGVQGVTTGFSRIDVISSGYRPGEMWYIGARPSMGKSSLLLTSLLAVAKSGNPALLVNREMFLGSINERFLSIESGIPYHKIRDGYLTTAEIDLLSATEERLKELPIYIDNNWTGNDSYVLSTIRKYHQLKGIRVVGIDYIQLLVERSDESTHELGRFSRNLKLLSGELGITSVVLSQLNRRLEERQDKRPMMFDLRQAGALEEDGDYMIGLYRDDVYRTNSPDEGKLEFIIRKARNAGLETVMLGFDGPTISVYDLDRLTEVQ